MENAKCGPFECLENVSGSGGIAPLILNLGTKWQMLAF